MEKTKNVLNIEYRDKSGKGLSKQARRDGHIPAVIYGKGQENRNLLLKAKDWQLLCRHDVNLVKLVDSGGRELNALVKEIQYNHIKNKAIHIDFLEISMDQIITTHIPLRSHGIPKGIAQGGVLEQVLYEIEISCLPAQLPEFIEAEIAHLELDQTLHIKDLALPDGVKTSHDPELTIFTVREQKEEVTEPTEAEKAAAEAATAEGAATEGGEATAEGETAAKGEATAKGKAPAGKKEDKEKGAEQKKDKDKK